MDLMTRIESLVRRKDLCVLATTGKDGPHTSLMAYACPADILHLYMLTPTKSLKYRNILASAAVSLMIDTREENSREQIQALTVNGRAGLVAAGKRRAAMALLTMRHPQLAALHTQGEVAVLQIVPAAFQLLDGVAQAHYLAVNQGAVGR